MFKKVFSHLWLRPVLNSLFATTIILATFTQASAQSGGTQVFMPVMSNPNSGANVEVNQDAAPDPNTLIDTDVLMQELGVVAEEIEILDEEPSTEAADELVALGRCWRSTLRHGNSGSSVRHAQNQLLKVGGTPAWYIRNSGGADGYFGRGTWSAVYSYQKMVFPGQSREWDGVIGSKTWAKLGCNRGNTPVRGSSSPKPTVTPTPRPAPSKVIGNYERVGSPQPNQVSVKGWAYLNTNQWQNLSIEVTVSTQHGRKHYTTANKVRDDVNRRNGVKGNHGFNAVFSNIPSGRASVCAKAIAGHQGGVLASKSLGCKSVTIQSPPPTISKARNNVSTYDCRSGPIRCDGAFSDNGYNATRYVNICKEPVNNVRLCYKLSEGTFTIPNALIQRVENRVAMVKDGSKITPFFGCSRGSQNTTCRYEIMDVKNLSQTSGWRYAGDKFRPWALKQLNVATCTAHVSTMDVQNIGECLADGVLVPYDGN